MGQLIRSDSSSGKADMSAFEAQIRELFGRAAYSHKTHEKCADLYTRKLGRIKLAQIVLSALTTGSLLSALFGGGKLITGLGALLAAISFGLNTYTKDYDLGKLAQRHADVAAKLWAVRESYLSLLTDLSTSSVEAAQARERRDELQKVLEAVYASAPRTTEAGYGKAQKALQLNEELTFSNEELDDLLPEPLRKANPSQLPK